MKKKANQHSPPAAANQLKTKKAKKTINFEKSIEMKSTTVRQRLAIFTKQKKILYLTTSLSNSLSVMKIIYNYIIYTFHYLTLSSTVEYIRRLILKSRKKVDEN